MLKLDDIACKIQSFILLEVQKPSFYFQQFAKMVVIQAMVHVQHHAPACKLNIKLCTFIHSDSISMNTSSKHLS